MRLYLKGKGITLRFILVCLLLISSFLPRTYLPYIVITILAVFSFIYFRKTLSGKVFAYFLIALFAISVISWLYNFFVYHDIDFLGLAIWWLTNLFPFLIIILVATLNENIDIRKVSSFYRYVLLIEFFIIVIQSIQKNIFYGDHARGTCLDAHALAIHFAIGIILTLSEIFCAKDQKKGINYFYLFIFLIGLIMTAFKANIIFLFVILALFFLYHLIRKLIIYKKNFRQYRTIVIAFLLIIGIGMVTLIQTYLISDISVASKMTLEKADGISEEYNIAGWENMEPWGGKIYSYYVSFLKIPGEINIISGYGPATYTSRAAQYRMSKLHGYASDIMQDRFNVPKENAEKLSSFLKIKISKLFDKYLYKVKFASTLNAPMTSIISFWVELGILGVAFLISFFTYLFIRLKKTGALNIESKNQILNINDFLALMLFLLILNLFYYNYWEYPEIMIPVMIFIALAITGKKKIVQ